MDIRITQTRPILGIQTQNAKLNIRNVGKTDFSVSHTDSQVLIESTNPKIHIDQTQCFADANLKNNSDFMAEIVQLAQQNVSQYIQKKAQQGDMLANIQYGGDAIIDAIRQDATTHLDYNYGVMPSHAPDIQLERGEVNVQVIEGKVNNQSRFVPIETEYIPYQIKFYMEQQPSIDIEYVGNNVDAKV